MTKPQKTEGGWVKAFDKRFVGEDTKPHFGDWLTPKNGKIIKSFISDLLASERQRCVEENKVTGETSDGYHTFNELYDFRKIFNATLFNEWFRQGKYEVHKSTRHSDGEECFGGGWFIVMATLPTGQISNHYEMKDWGLFDCQVRQRADKWDGHTASDVLDRLKAIDQAKHNLKQLK